jgi:hypothetical protein
VSLKGVKPIHLYSAVTWPTPQEVTVLMEGMTDVAALSSFMSSLAPWWRGLRIRLVDCGGDELPRRYRDANRADPTTERIVVVCDGDKRGDKAWADVFRHEHLFVIEPDLEMLNLTALASAIMSVYGIVVDEVDLNELWRRFDNDRKSVLPGRSRTFAQQIERDLRVSGLKRIQFADVLGERLAQYRDPTLTHITQMVTAYCEGWSSVALSN